jgi:leucyl aminopeptidase
LGLNRSALSAQGFEGKIGQTLVVLGAAGATLVAVGIGDPRKITSGDLRLAAAALARATSRRSHVATNLVDAVTLDARRTQKEGNTQKEGKGEKEGKREN